MTPKNKNTHGLVDIHVDWKPAVNGISVPPPLNKERLKAFINSQMKSKKGHAIKGLSIPQLHEIIAQPIQAIIKLHKKFEKGHARIIAGHYLDFYLNDFFMVVNLAAPGTCNFHNTTVIHSMKPFHFQKRLNLSCYPIEQAIIFSRHLGWPIIKDIEMGLVHNWLKSLKIGTKQVAQSRIERVLFALLNALHGDTEVTHILWLSHALEAFYDTPAIEIVKNLRNRSFKWLSVPEHNKKAIKKEFDNFYKIRSSFVHGEFEIIHPLSNEKVDKDVDTQYEKIYHARDFGLATLIASIQSLIENNYYELNFDELIQGRSI